MDNIEAEVRSFSTAFEAHFKARLIRKKIVKSGALQSGFRTDVAKQGETYRITVYFSEYGRIIDQFAYRRGFKYRDESKILKRPQNYKWWRGEFPKVFTTFVEDITEKYAQKAVNTLFEALDFNNSIFA